MSADDRTIPSRPTKPLVAPSRPSIDETSEMPNLTTPALLRQYFDGEIDLDAEFSARYPNMPLMSLINFRALGAKTRTGIATLSTQDGAASLMFHIEAATRALTLTYTMGSLMSLRFEFDALTNADRMRWLDVMRDGGSNALAFLWGQSRWDQDYMVCCGHKYFTTFYASSPHRIEAAVRVTPEATRKLIDWLGKLWTPSRNTDAPNTRLTTW